MSTIFVQIASYRDPQLLLTLNDMIKQAKYPENLRVGICNQYSPDDEFNIDKFQTDPRFRIDNVFYTESKGVCWARHMVQQRYSGETYTLQIDSHMRFEKNWDEEMIRMIKNLQDKGYKKPLLTGYVSSFDPENDPKGRTQEPWRMVFDRFTPEGCVFFLPETIPGWKDLKEPIPARFYSAHFCFTLGEFSKEVQHDPEYYFHGEEISITVRAYAHGYDLFHPHKVLIWHEYSRKSRTKVWDDDKEWYKKNDASHKRNRQLFGMDGEEKKDFGIYGFGNERTLRDYEKYAGILFEKRSVQDYTLQKNYPPNPYEFQTEDEWLSSFTKEITKCFKVNKNQLEETDYQFWAIIFNKDGKTLFRQDANIGEIQKILTQPEDEIEICRTFQTTSNPDSWVLWPFSKTKNWCSKIEMNF
jgi:hypothetical protein